MHAASDLLFEIDPVTALSLCSFAKREAYLRPDDVKEMEASYSAGIDEKVLNMIDMIPEKIEVKEAEIWKNKDTSKIKDFQTVEIINDWTFSSPYKGSIRWLSDRRE